MIFVILYAFLCFFLIDTSFDFPIFFAVLLAISIVSGIAHIILFTAAVCSDAKRKGLGARIVWTVLTFILGFPAGMFYALFTFKAGKYEDSKRNNKNIKLSAAAVVLMLIFAIGSTGFVHSKTNYDYTHFSKYEITYKNSDGEDVVYDKMGNAYTREEYENFKYYGRDGKTYTIIIDYDIFSNVPEIYGVRSTESDKDYTEFDMYDFFIDRDGYLVMVPDNEFEYSSLGVRYDDEQNIYYDISSVYWTPDGEMLFVGNEDLSKITYQDILTQAQLDSQTQRENNIDDFFGFFERSDWEYMPYHCTEDFWSEYFDGNAVAGLESAELIQITEQGTYENDKDRYYIIANAKCRPAKGSALYDGNSEYITLRLRLVFEYDEYEWKPSEISVLT